MDSKARPVSFQDLPQADLEDWRGHPVSKYLIRYLQEQGQQYMEESCQAAIRGVHHLASSHAGAASALGDVFALCTVKREPPPASSTDTTFIDPVNIKRKNGHQSLRTTDAE